MDWRDGVPLVMRVQPRAAISPARAVGCVRGGTPVPSAQKRSHTRIHSRPTPHRRTQDAINEAMRDWVTNVRDTHYIIGTATGEGDCN